MEENYLSIGGFAELSGIKRKTLIYYDQVDLLKPRKVSSNGYRYYHYHQLYTANMIHFFRDIGMSLKEIKEYNRMKAPDQMVELIQSQKEEVRQKQLYYSRMEQMLDLQMQSLKETENFSEGQISVVTHEEMPLFYSVRESPYREGTRVSVSLSAFYQECMAAGYEFPYPSGMMVFTKGQQEIEQSKIRYYIKVPESTTFRAKGNYLQFYSKGILDCQNGYEQLLNYAQKQGLKVKGNLYVDFIQNELVAQSFDDFLLKLMIQID